MKFTRLLAGMLSITLVLVVALLIVTSFICLRSYQHPGLRSTFLSDGTQVGIILRDGTAGGVVSPTRAIDSSSFLRFVFWLDLDLRRLMWDLSLIALCVFLSLRCLLYRMRIRTLTSAVGATGRGSVLGD